ncbi:unnamed protein product [Amoebophrya sp. A120]|nr:unnamed protein product [Amoebophrya sp. A120]|eukprot:GSA120T00005781001.1
MSSVQNQPTNRPTHRNLGPQAHAYCNSDVEDALASQIASSAAAAACVGCTGKQPRRGWTEADLISQPVGVYAFKCTPPHRVRYHALFPVSRTDQRFAGCFATAQEAAQAWDAAARAGGWRVVNAPRDVVRELAFPDYLRGKIAAAKQPAATFPHPPSEVRWRTNELKEVLRDVAERPVSKIWNGPRGLQQDDHDTAAGNELCWSFHPHAAEVRKTTARGTTLQGTRPSALDTWHDLALRAKCVRSCIEYRGDQEVSRMTLAGELRFMQGSWVLNFQPRVAAAIYERFAGNAAVVYDSSAGWGGRLLGAFLASNVSKYIACEPSSNTFAGLEQLRDLVLEKLVDDKKGGFVVSTENGRRMCSLDIELHKCGSEDFVPPKNSVDLAFTSPPYFSLERYATEPSQSHVRFPTFPQWCAGFLQPTLTHTFEALKPGGAMLINIANCKIFTDRGIDLEAETVRIAVKVVGARQETTLRLLKMDGTEDNGEPIFVFRK